MKKFLTALFIFSLTTADIFAADMSAEINQATDKIRRKSSNGAGICINTQNSATANLKPPNTSKKTCGGWGLKFARK
jgi:hypothetical protein